MPPREAGWTLLVYKLPPQPTRLRIQVWRKLQAIGTVYVQDGVAVLPSREDLDENLAYIAATIEEMGGSAILLRAVGMTRRDSAQMVERFRKAADARMVEVLERLRDIKLPETHSLEAIEEAEGALKRERFAYLKLRRLSYCGSDREAEVEERLAEIRREIDRFVRGVK